MKYNTQTDKIWSKEIMTKKPGVWIDYLWRWGCLVTCIANILQEIFDKVFTPKDLNDLIKKLKLYKYLNDPSTPENQASILLTAHLFDYYKKIVLYYPNLSTDKWNNKDFFIAEIKNKWGSHFINIITKRGDYFLCFDVEDGILKYIKEDDIIDITKIVKI